MYLLSMQLQHALICERKLLKKNPSHYIESTESSMLINSEIMSELVCKSTV